MSRVFGRDAEDPVVEDRQNQMVQYRSGDIFVPRSNQASSCMSLLPLMQSLTSMLARVHESSLIRDYKVVWRQSF